MLSTPEEQKQAILAAVGNLAEQRLPKQDVPQVKEFIGRYYGQVDPEDLVDRAVEDLYGAALAHLSFARQFASGHPKLRVYNPRMEEHGWTSPHTIIEIVNDDMPFLVDSVTMEVNRQGYTLQLFVHPLFRTRRSGDGTLERLSDSTKDGQSESFIHVEIERELDPARLKTLGEGIIAVLADVRSAVADWQPMRERMATIVSQVAAPPGVAATEDIGEIRAFLEWVNDNHFTYLGYREYDLIDNAGEEALRIVPNSGLGVLREPKLGGVSASFHELPASLRKLARERRLLILTKANSRSTVHRPGYLDYIGVKRFDAQGKVIGERRFVGLYTSSAYHERLSDIPLLRRKSDDVIKRAGFTPSSHLGKNLVSVLEDYPRDELLQIDPAQLYAHVTGILRLGDRRKTRVFVRRDVYGRFYSCLVYLPRELFNTENRVKIQEILRRTFNGSSTEFTVQLSEAVLARIHIMVRTKPAEQPEVDAHAIEAEIARALRRWDDDLEQALVEDMGEGEGVAALRAFKGGFPAAYRESVSPRAAVLDITTLAQLNADATLALRLYRPVEATANALRLRVYRLGSPVPLSGSLPMLENMGVTVLDEQAYTVARAGGDSVYIHDFGLKAQSDVADIERVKPLFEEAFGRVWHGVMESDGFNRLTLRAALSADEVTLIRAYAKYLKQAGFTFSQAYVENTLTNHAAVAASLVQLFHARFDPAATGERVEAQKAIEAQIIAALNDVANLDEDRILRRFLQAMQATIRTNYYQSGINGLRKPYLSFKFESAKVPELPEPRPLYEIWVYSPRVEGIHLRGGKVARGGLRWSDRMEDFRTEVLGLVKAQMVKNSVIVPVGSKGGFVVKNPPPQADREAYLKEGIECYKNFLRGLLDITDNLISGKVVPPKDVVRHDADDPYLVVAADKGTATFSDIANSVSADYHFWLGDAFASGGSAGYDHKKMGITARGAWESVKRHFREMGINTQTTDFTVVGVGDMSGDVFGNGMLLSPHIRLIAAFDHRHIFLDPLADAATSFKERERLFNLARSSWADYDEKLISKGGGVYPRSAKSIPISPQVKQALGITQDVMTPAELMRAILQAPVDLLYNGGIGTYVKSSQQTNAEVGDRANDAIRVNGKELRCKVIAEGGNLGLTQLGRIEYALAGGRVYTDAIDNSAGVDCSDHEVNIKILLNAVMEDGELTEKQRNKLLADMTDEVGELVLADNYYQTQSLSVSGVRGGKLLDAQAAFIRALEKTGRLKRDIEFLPDDDEIAQRKLSKAGLTAPERAVLLAYSKMVLFDELVASDLVDDPYVAQALIGYFPKALQERYRDLMPRHPLKREIIATVVANTMVNRVGSVFVHRMREETGATSAEVVRAFTLVRDIFDLEKTWSEIDALDNLVPAKLQSDMHISAGRTVLRATLWFLRRRREKMPIADVLNLFRPGVAAMESKFEAYLSEPDRKAYDGALEQFTSAGVPPSLAKRIASMDALYAMLDITEIGIETKEPIDKITAMYFALFGKLDLRWFAVQISQLPSDTPWQASARNALRDDLVTQQRLLTATALKLGGAGDVNTTLTKWEDFNRLPLARMREMVASFKSGPQPDLAMLSVLLRELRSLA